MAEYNIYSLREKMNYREKAINFNTYYREELKVINNEMHKIGEGLKEPCYDMPLCRIEKQNGKNYDLFKKILKRKRFLVKHTKDIYGEGYLIYLKKRNIIDILIDIKNYIVGLLKEERKY